MPGRPSLVGVSLLVLLAAAAGAEEPGFDACDPSTAMRLSFLEKRLDLRATPNALWWRGWTALYVAAAAAEGVQAGLEDDRGERADHVVDAAKSAIGTAAMLLDPPAGRRGADPLRELPADDPEGCARRLAAAEELLHRSAEESRERYTWLPHVGNLALNLAGALIVTQAFDEKGGWISGGIGVAVGELTIWSRPWKADEDLAEYEDFVARLAGAPPKASWALVTDGRSLRIEVRY